MKNSLEVITTDWTIEKISEPTDKAIQISQTKVQSEKTNKKTQSCIDLFIVGQYQDMEHTSMWN